MFDRLAQTTSARSAFLVAAILWFAMNVASAQVPTGIPAFGTYDGDGLVTTNLAYLNMHVDIPLRSSNARNLGLSVFLTMDDAFQMQGSSPDITYVPAGGFQMGASLTAVLVEGSITSAICNNQRENTYTINGTRDGHSTVHGFSATHIGEQPIVISQYGCANPSSGSSTTVDGWFISASVSTGGQITATIVDPYGRTYTPSVMTDTNGNQVSFNSSTQGYVDASGNTILTTSPSSYTYTGPSSPPPETYTPTYTSYTVGTNFGCSGETAYSSAGQTLLTKLTRPDGSYYAFSYEPTRNMSGAVTGRLASVTLPTGAVITYAYTGGTNGINCVDGSTAGFTKTTPDGQWTFSHSTSSGYGTTTVQAPSGDYVTYNFSSQFEVQRKAFAVGGTLLGKTITCYNGTFSNCSTNNSLLMGPISQTDVYFYPGTSTSPSLVETKVLPSGEPTQVSRYDFGASVPPGSNFLSQTTINYGSWNGSTCVSSVKKAAAVCDSITTGGNTQARYNTYDANGNLTTQKDLVSGTTYLTKTFTYYSTGLVHVATDVNGAQTTYTDGACNSSFPTTISEPLGLSKSMTWDCNGEVVTSNTDENGQPTQYGYVNQAGVADPFWRVLSTTDPTGAVITTCYGLISGGSCTLNPNQIETVLTFNSGASAVDQLITTDGLGRAIISQKKQSPTSSNFDTVSTTYDIDGRVAAVTVPCVQTAGQRCPASPATSTTYDGLSRPVLITDAGGGTTGYSYSINDILQTIGPPPTNENTKQRQMEYDGLGRLTSVCELTSSANGGGACSQNSPQTGYWTKYVYDALGNLSSVTQNAQGSSVQTRSFTYDDLSRLTSETNPEWNSVAATYTYDTDGTCGTYNGDLVKKVDPAGNVTCSQFDALHRVTAATYPSGPNSAATPPQAFVYDSTTFTCPAAPTVPGNVAGRLAEAYTGSSNSKITDVGFCYSARGETTDVFESTPNSGGYYHTATSYWANGTANTLAGYLASGSTFVPTQTYTPDGEGRWKSVAASSGPNPISTAAYNAASQITGITYGSTDTDAFLYDNAGRMNKYTFTLNGSSEVSTPTWNANDTLQTLTITDPFNSSNAQTCTYAYDDIIRITSANCGTPWSQTFSYDPFGNITKSGSVSWQPGYTQTTNRYSLAGTAYDADGNLTNDSFHAYAWGSNGRPVSIGGKTMTYDALGRMVEKLDGSAYTQFVYGPSGSLLARMSGQSATSVRVPLPGSWAVYGSSSTFNHYEHLDWLGNSRLSSSQSRTMTSDIAYAPFGEPYASTATSGVSFTGMRSDVIAVSGGVTNGLYDFLARELPPTQGRWISPDPAGIDAADPTNPQSWNRYEDVLNNPLAMFDSTGLCGEITAGVGTTSSSRSGKAILAVAQALQFDVAFPYSGLSTSTSLNDIAWVNHLGNQSATDVSVDAIQAARIGSFANGTGFVSVGFSGGAQSNLSAFDQMGIMPTPSNTVLLDPGLGPEWSVPSGVDVVRGSHDWSWPVNSTSTGGNTHWTNCGHDAACLLTHGAIPGTAIGSAGPCPNPMIFERGKPPMPLGRSFNYLDYLLLDPVQNPGSTTTIYYGPQIPDYPVPH